MALVLLGASAREVAGVEWGQHVAAAALALYVGHEWRRLPRAGKIIAAAAAAVSLAAAFALPDARIVALRAERAACFFPAFFVAVGLLRLAAERSEMIRRCGLHMLAQPPGRRYAALTLGANLFGLILSFGTLQLLGAMTRRANTLATAGGDERVRAVRERRMLLAVLRGFAMAPGWSPLSVALALALSVTPGAHWQEVVAVAFVVAMLLLALGWLHDRLGNPAPRAGIALIASPDRWTVQLRLLGLVGGIVVLTMATERAFDLRLVDAVMLCVPLVAVGWLAVQQSRWGPRRAIALALRGLVRRARAVFPGWRMEIAILAGAGFAGAMAAPLIPTTAVAAAFEALRLPGVAAPGLVVLLMALGGQLALNPIVTVSLIGAAMPPAEALGVAPAALAAAYMTGWAVAVGSSPFTLSTLIVADLAGRTGQDVAWTWNGRFSLAAVLLAALALAAASLALA